MKRGRSAAGDFRVVHNIAGDLTVALQTRDRTPADSDGATTGDCVHASWRASGGCGGECMYIIIMTKLQISMHTHIHTQDSREGRVSKVSLVTPTEEPNMLKAATLIL